MSECGDGDRRWSVLKAHPFSLDVLKYLSAAVMIYLSLLTLKNQDGGLKNIWKFKLARRS